MRCVLRAVLGLIFGRAGATGLGVLAMFGWDCAGRSAAAQQPAGQSYEFSMGAEASRQAWSLYSGTTYAPFGSITEDGWRVRAAGGYGAFRYSGERAAGAGSQLVSFRGTVSFADVLLGYHRQLGPLTLKLYAGAMATQHLIDPFDPEARIQGTGFGGKAVLESWWTISDQAWASLDLSYGSLHASTSGRLRLGWRLLPALSTGLEAGAAGNADGDIGRLGAFLRYEWEGGEIATSAGLMVDWAGIDKIEARGAFATVSWMNRF